MRGAIPVSRTAPRSSWGFGAFFFLLPFETLFSAFPPLRAPCATVPSRGLELKPVQAYAPGMVFFSCSFKIFKTEV